MFVSISFCGGSRGYFSSDLGSQFLGGGSDPKKNSRIYKINSYVGRIVGSNFEGGDRTEVKPHKKDRTEKFLFSRISGLNFWGGIGPKCGFVVSIFFFSRVVS